MSSIKISGVHIREMVGAKETGIQAFADVEFNDGELTIKSFPIVKTKEGETFCSLPRVQKKGSQEWFPVMKASDELKKIIQESVMEKYNESNEGWGE